jgi:hypothetical protein
VYKTFSTITLDSEITIINKKLKRVKVFAPLAAGLQFKMSLDTLHSHYIELYFFTLSSDSHKVYAETAVSVVSQKVWFAVM